MRERRQIGIIQLGTAGSEQEIRAFLRDGPGGARGGEDNTAEALAAFGLDPGAAS